MAMAQQIGTAVAQAVANAMVGRGQPPIGRGGIYGIVLAVCLALIGSPVVGSVMSAEETATQLEALKQRDAEMDAKFTGISAWKGDIDRRLATEQRINTWLVTVEQKQTAALREIAKALNIEVDLEMPVLWPEQ